MIKCPHCGMEWENNDHIFYWSNRPRTRLYIKSCKNCYNRGNDPIVTDINTKVRCMVCGKMMLAISGRRNCTYYDGYVSTCKVCPSCSYIRMKRYQKNKKQERIKRPYFNKRKYEYAKIFGNDEDANDGFDQW